MLLVILGIITILVSINMIKNGESCGLFAFIPTMFLLWAVLGLPFGGICYLVQSPSAVFITKITSNYTIDMKISDEELEKAREVTKFGGKYLFQLNKEHYESPTTINTIIWPMRVGARDVEVWRIVPENAKKE